MLNRDDDIDKMENCIYDMKSEEIKKYPIFTFNDI